MPERVIATVDAFDVGGTIRPLKIIQNVFEVRTGQVTSQRLGEKRIETTFGQDVQHLGGNRYQVADTGELLQSDAKGLREPSGANGDLG